MPIIVVVLTHSPVVNLDITNISLLGTQAIFFVNDWKNIQSTKLLSAILPRYAHLFDGGIEAIPLPPEVPPEVPRLILRSANDVWQLHVGLNKVIVYSMPPNEPSEKKAPDVYTDKCIEILLELVTKGAIQPYRLALVLTHFVPTQEAAVECYQNLISNYSQQTLGVPHNFDLLIQNRGVDASIDLEVNWLTRFTSVTLEATKEPGLQYQRDINTVEDQMYKFSPAKTKEFFSWVCAVHKNDLNRFFSGGE